MTIFTDVMLSSLRDSARLLNAHGFEWATITAREDGFTVSATNEDGETVMITKPYDLGKEVE